MTRIYRHTIADAPEASRPLLEGYVPFSPTGKLLNLHAQMAHSPLVLAAYAAASRITATSESVLSSPSRWPSRSNLTSAELHPDRTARKEVRASA